MKLTLKLSSDLRFRDWFPKRTVRHNLPRSGAEVYKLSGASTVRYQNSPLNRMRRLLNDLEKKKLPNVPVY